jgi:hypothetical protein
MLWSICSHLHVISHPVSACSGLVLPSHLRLHFRNEDTRSILVKKYEGERQFGRPTRVWDYDIEMDLKENGGTWTEYNPAQDMDKW